MALFTAIATAAGASAAAISVAGAVGQLVAGVALNALAGALFAPDVPADPGARIQTQVQQEIVARNFVVGRTAPLASLVFHTTMGIGADDDTENYVAVFALSDLPVKALTGLWIDGQRCTIDGSAGWDEEHGWKIPELADDDGTVKAWFRFYDGTQTTADQRLIDHCSTEDWPWTANHVGRGIAYIIVTTDYDPTVYPNGRPSFSFEVQGLEIEDPSTGSTGTADNLPAAQIYRLLQGVSYGGQWLYGPQRQAVLPSAVWNKAITECRKPVPGASSWTDARKREAFGGTTVPARYRSGMQISVDRPVADTIKDLASACNGRFSEVAGAFRFQVGDPPATADFTFSDDDLLTTREHSFTPFFPLAETVNAVTAVYPDPAQLYEEQEAPPLYRPALEAEDGNRRLTTTARMPAVPYKEQVQRLMKAALDEARRARRHTIVLPPKFWVVEPGDYGAWTSARNGYQDKLFRVDGVTDEEGGDVVLDITEVDPSDYDFDADDFTPVVSGSVVRTGPATFVVPGFDVRAHVIKLQDGTPVRPGIKMTWDKSRTGRRIAYRVFAAGTNDIVTSGNAEYSDGEIVTGDNIVRNADLEVQVRRVMQNGRTPWSSRYAVTAPNVGFTEADFDAIFQEKLDAAQAVRDDLDALTEDFVGNLKDRFGLTEEQISQVNTTLNNKISGVSSNLTQNYLTGAATDQAIAAVDTRLSTRADNAAGFINSILGLEVGPSRAFGVLLDDLQVDANGTSAKVRTQGNAIVDLEGNAKAGYLIQAQAGNQVAKIDLIAADGSGQRISSIVFTADNILANGSLYSRHHSSRSIDTEILKIDGVRFENILKGAATRGASSVKNTKRDVPVMPSPNDDATTADTFSYTLNNWSNCSIYASGTYDLYFFITLQGDDFVANVSRGSDRYCWGGNTYRIYAPSGTGDINSSSLNGVFRACSDTTVLRLHLGGRPTKDPDILGVVINLLAVRV
ncbi:putative tail protein [Palleronia aestuarii]|uniref:Putative tail protein n=1 Tax=Palleronia aestuarii TaxID=568105 RepID=A0A2W7NHC5_9RHOB|nr:phage tail protein [Palleronia aestuarii]PZX19825.1 putative tail protein [Palleronia aestuarii]